MLKEMYRKRRNKLAEALGKRDFAIIFADSEPAGIQKFRQNNNFMYFTGLELPDAIMFVGKGVTPPEKEYMAYEQAYIQRNIPERIVWDGKKMEKDEATEISGIKNVKYLDEFLDDIAMHLAGKEKVYINSGFGSLRKPLNKQMEFIKKVRDRFPNVVFTEITETLIPLRSVKDVWEIEQMKKAIDLTWNGIESIWKQARPGMMEYELEAMLYYEMHRRGYRNWGFAPIVATGVNAATLHYIKNETQIKEGECVLLDVGASCSNYSADITRTFPIDGRFTDRQKAVYKEVLNVQKQVIEMVKPEASLKEINKNATELIQEALLKLELIKEKSEYFKYYPHSIGHHLGMDTHDIASRETVLKPGNVITVEPGIYINDEKLGIRIEDDILVTEDGFEVLSKQIPKEAEEIEEIRIKSLEK